MSILVATISTITILNSILNGTIGVAAAVTGGLGMTEDVTEDPHLSLDAGDRVPAERVSLDSRIGYRRIDHADTGNGIEHACTRMEDADTTIWSQSSGLSLPVPKIKNRKAFRLRGNQPARGACTQSQKRPVCFFKRSTDHRCNISAKYRGPDGNMD